MTQEIKVGDKVRLNRTIIVDYDRYTKDTIGVVNRIGRDTDIFVTMREFYSGKDKIFFCCASNLDVIEPYDRKTDFLQKLGALLKEFDAEIGDRGRVRIERVEITFGDDTPPIRYTHSTLNTDNIMDFEKE